MKFDDTFLDTLTEQAKQSLRLRIHYDLRDSENDPCIRKIGRFRT